MKAIVNRDVNDSKYLAYLDIIRIFACFWVIFNHTNSRGLTFFTTRGIGSLSYWGSMCFAIFCGISVSLFFMISGATLLEKTESLKDLFTKRILRMLIVLFVFSFFYYVRKLGWDMTSFSILDFLSKVVQDRVIVPFWYLYLYLCFLLCLPFLRKFANNVSEKEYRYLFWIAFVFSGVLKVIQIKFGFSVNSNLTPSILTNTVFLFPLLGLWINKREKIKNSELIVGGVIFVILMILACLLTHWRIVETGELSEGAVGKYFSSFHMFFAFYVFAVFKKVFSGITFSPTAKKVFSILGSLVFGTYLLEQFFREELYFIYDKMASVIYPFAAILIYVLMIQIICMIVVFILKRIPGIRKLI